MGSQDALWRALERAIRQGDASRVVPQLERLAKTRLSREDRVRVAALAYRCGAPGVGLRLLRGRVRGEEKGAAARAAAGTATCRERAVYAACLLRAGGLEEAARLLEGLDPAEEAVVLFYRAAAHMSAWDYAAAVPLLEAYVARREPAAYERLVGRVNLLAATVVTRRWTQAKALAHGLLHDTGVRRLPLLHGNTLELAAQMHLLRREWKEAEKAFALARRLVEKTGTMDSLLVLKGEAFLAWLRDGDRRPLAGVREEARRRGHWETGRDCDRFEAVETPEEALLWRVYFGTPHAAYRSALLADYRAGVGKSVEPPSTYVARYGPEGGVAVTGAVLDLTEENDGRPEPMPPLVRRLLVVLARDRYAPTRIATLFGKLFPAERFSEETSLLRVHQAVSRARRWLKRVRSPFLIDEKAGSYRLDASVPAALRLNTGAPADPSLLPERRIRDAFGDAPFSSGEAETKLRIARRTLQRELDRLVAAGTLKREGAGRATRYRRKRSG